ncbi:unnamed protein product, partial [Owenia fusiformis]
VDTVKGEFTEDISKLDPEKPVICVFKHNMHCEVFKGTYWLNMWPKKWKIPDIPAPDCFGEESDMDLAEWYKTWMNFKAREDDIIISAYPKSGHHWMFEVVQMLLNHTTKSANKCKESNFIEIRTMEELEAMPSPRILLTHFEYDHMAPDILKKGCKIFYIYRNPKDVAVSFFYHMTTVQAGTGTWDQYFDLLISGTHQAGRWLDNVPNWWEKIKNDKNTLILSYEQMKKDFVTNVKKLSEFLGKTYDMNFYEEVEKACSIKAMKKNPKLDPLTELVKQGKPGMIRKGEIGGWKNYFTVAQNELFDAEYHKVMVNHKDLVVEFE